VLAGNKFADLGQDFVVLHDRHRTPREFGSTVGSR
jgi:hypothetical protein